jgi:hypothetical protein
VSGATLAVFSGCCSETEVSEQRYFLNLAAGAVAFSPDRFFEKIACIL